MRALVLRRRSLVLVTLVLVSLVAACGSGHHHQTGLPSGASSCPLTDLPAPGGKVPQRPALAVKVDNLPAARPPYGLGTADVIYEQPVEGGITRFIGIYQCQDASRIEPIRSARFIDPQLVNQYGAHPLFGYAGAIPAVVTKIDQSPLIDVGFVRAANAYHRDPARQAPHNLVSSTAALYAAGAAQHAPATPPAPVFHYGALAARHQLADAVRIRYPQSDVSWTWDQLKAHWLRNYAGTGPATLAGGGHITTTNIVVMRVVLYPGPDGQNLLHLTGSGPVQVFRNDAVIDGTWKRPSLSDLTELVDAAGHPIALAPGQTWIELVPTTVSVTVTT